MRKSTANLRKQLADAEQADDALASKLQAMLSFIEKSERARVERDDAFRAALAEDQAAFLGEATVMKSEITAMIAELRGTPVAVQVNHEQPQRARLKAAE